MRLKKSRKSRLKELQERRELLERQSTEQPAAVAPMAAEVPHGIKVAGDLAWRFIVIAVALAMVVWGLSQLSSVVIPVAVALLFTGLGQPLVDLLNKRLNLNRYLAAFLALLVGIAILGALIAAAGNQLVSGLSQLSDQVGEGLDRVRSWLSTGPLQIGGEQLADLLARGEAWVQSNSGTLTSGAIAAGSTATNLVAGLLIALVVTVFLLGDGANIWGWLVRLLPTDVRDSVHNAGRRGWTTVGAYVRTQIIVAGIDAVGIALGAWILGVPLAIPIGLIVFIASFIPMVGAILSGALAVLVALVSQGLVTAVWMLLVVLLVQQIESNVLQPVLMSRSVSLHPLATLLGVAVGSYLVGIAGAVFAVPLIAFVNVVVLYLRGHDKFPELGVEPYPRAQYEITEQEAVRTGVDAVPAKASTAPEDLPRNAPGPDTTGAESGGSDGNAARNDG